ncbi:hypothetical protein Aduo_014450 [Ancylostoma duodenale]
MMAVFVTLLNLAQPPLRRLIKHYFPDVQAMSRLLFSQHCEIFGIFQKQRSWIFQKIRVVECARNVVVRCRCHIYDNELNKRVIGLESGDKSNRRSTPLLEDSRRSK